MPNKFEGQVLDTNGQKLEGVKVTLNGKDIPSNTFTTTDIDGKWSILLAISLDAKDVTVTFSKPGLESKQVTNPQPTEVLNGYIDPVKGGTLDLKGLYESGTYLVDSLSNESKEVIKQELEDLFEFTKNNPGNVKITITSSESQVTNTDNDPGDGVDRTDEFRKTPGSLAKARAEALKKYVNDFLDKKYIENPNLNSNGRPTIEFGEIDRQGGEEWERYYTPSPTNPNILVINERPNVISENKQLLEELKASDPNTKVTRTADLPKYKNDQYTRITVELASKDCLANNLVFDVMYLGSNHCCNSATYQIKANGQILLRDDGNNYASLNNNISQYWAGDPDVVLNPYKEIKNYENVVTGYNTTTTTGATEDEKRFKFLLEGDIFPINDTAPPKVNRIAGHRFNRFIINSSKLKELTAGLNEKIITFSIACYKPLPAKNYKDFWGANCHEGVGSFLLYKIKPQDNSFVVTYASELLTGKTPSTRDQNVILFKYDVCKDEIIETNPDVFSTEALNSVKSDN
jgi:hypothetical protein